MAPQPTTQVSDNSATLPASPASPLAAAPPIGSAPKIEGASNAIDSLAQGKKKSRAPRKDGLVPSTATVSGVPAMYTMVSNIPFYTVTKKQISTFIPSFIACAFVINQLNFTASYTHRFLQGAPAWIPPMTFLYCGTLFIIQTLRAQREVGDISADELWLLEGFEKMYDLRALLIPGPLVPYFQALAACSGPFEHIGDVTPRVPTSYPTAADRYCHANGLQILMPNIPLYMDALVKDMPTFAASTDGTTVTLPQLNTFTNKMKYFWSTVHTANATTTGTGSRPFYSPGAWSPVSFTEQQMTTYSGFRSQIGFPPRLNTTTSGDMTNLAQFLRFYQPGPSNTEFYPWFGNVAGIMQRYCQFFKESVPLSAIPPAATSSCIPVWKYSANARLTTPYVHHAAVAATATTGGFPAYFEAVHLHSLAASGHHVDLSLEEIEEQSSAVAQINIDTATSSGLGSPANATVRTGPVWTLPEVRASPVIDYANSVSSTISLHYHVDTRVN